MEKSHDWSHDNLPIKRAEFRPSVSVCFSLNCRLLLWFALPWACHPLKQMVLALPS